MLKRISIIAFIVVVSTAAWADIASVGYVATAVESRVDISVNKDSITWVLPSSGRMTKAFAFVYVKTIFSKKGGGD